MKMREYGHFSKDGLEFIITNPVTPRPWINYLTNEDYCAIISHNAGGYSFYKDCRSDRILRWLPECWHFDRPGRYIFVRDVDSEKYWSASYQPIRQRPQFYETRHGLGYTITDTTYHGINIRITFFVPEKDTCEVWLVSITNKTNRKRNLQVFPYIEWLLGDYHQELRYRNIMNLYNRVWYDRPHKAIFAKKTAFWQDMNIKPYPYIDFFASGLSVAGYATHKDTFLGRYNTEERPESVISGTFKNTELTSGEDAIACLKHNLKLRPGQTKEFTVTLGQTDKRSRLLKILDKYRNIRETKKELDKVKLLWQERILNNIVVKTPDKRFDRIINIWVKYQLYICNLWSRSPSYYHEGSGGRGYRDSCQDAESIMSINPGHAKSKINALLSLIRRNGTCAPGFSSTTGPARHRPNKDHPVWLTYTVAAYIKETGDKSILEEYAPYLKDGWVNKGWEQELRYRGGPRADGEGTVFEHLEKNLNFTFNDVGPKGLPLIGHADWNDAIDAAGIRLKGESVWLAMALVRSLKILAELALLIGKEDKADELRHKAQTMADRINDVAWDGDWYVRGFADDGTVYGSRENKEGKIYINTQSWSILSGVADKAREKRLLRSVDRYLDGPCGIALFYPAYSKWNPRLGRISMFSQGTKENAAVFCHAATFQIVAECIAGRGTKAYKFMKKIMPDAQRDYALYKTEPYAYAEYIVGPQHPYLYGEGGFTWVTGNAGWNFQAATEWLLGARRDYEGLRVDPCIPKKWKRCRIRRPFRGAVYDIRISNPKGIEKGVKRILVDGEEISGTLIYPHSDNKLHNVEVLMG